LEKHDIEGENAEEYLGKSSPIITGFDKNLLERTYKFTYSCVLMLSPHTENFINCLSQLKLLFSAKRFSQSFISENPRAKQELHKTIENYSLCPRIMDVGHLKFVSIRMTF
jgi:hypothetical protein